MLLIFTALLPSVARSQETELKRARTPFDMGIMSDFISFDLSATQPRTSIKAEGGPTRTIHGTLLDHNGEPVAGAFVAFTSRIGYGDRNYFENFDVTDARGRFVVEAHEERERLVFHRGAGLVWPVQLEDDDSQLTVRWPAPASLN